MSETLLKSQPSFEPPRARLAHLLAQLSELDPEGEKILKLEALLEQKAEERAHTERAGLERSRFEAVPARRLKLEPIPFKAATPAASVIGNVDEAEAETESISNESFAPVKAYRKQAALSSKAAVKKSTTIKKKTVAATARQAANAPRPAGKARVAAKPPVVVKRKAAARFVAKPAAAKPAAVKTVATKSQAKSRAQQITRPAKSNAFHAALRAVAGKQGVADPEQLFSPSAFAPIRGLTSQGPLGMVLRAFGWLQSRVKVTASKRLRLQEVVNLGDKRFVALVKVEDREFLIGGAASGLSLLANLEGAKKSAAGMLAGGNPT